MKGKEGAKKRGEGRGSWGEGERGGKGRSRVGKEGNKGKGNGKGIRKGREMVSGGSRISR